MARQLEQFEELYDRGTPPLVIMQEMDLSPKEYEELHNALVQFRHTQSVPVRKLYNKKDLDVMWGQIEDLFCKISCCTTIDEKLKYERELEELSMKYARIDITEQLFKTTKKKE